MNDITDIDAFGGLTLGIDGTGKFSQAWLLGGVERSCRAFGNRALRGFAQLRINIQSGHMKVTKV